MVVMLLASLFVGRMAILLLAGLSAAQVTALAVLSRSQLFLIAASYVAISLFLGGGLAFLFSTLFASALKASREEARRSAALREQLLHAQKMEAIGRLAGGIAHDFNNILTVVTGGAEVLAADATSSPASRALAEELVRMAKRATTLTRQLLDFSRKGPSQQPRPFDARAALARLETMLVRIVGRDVHLSLPSSEEPVSVLADPGQFEQGLHEPRDERSGCHAGRGHHQHWRSAC